MSAKLYRPTVSSQNKVVKPVGQSKENKKGWNFTTKSNVSPANRSMSSSASQITQKSKQTAKTMSKNSKVRGAQKAKRRQSRKRIQPRQNIKKPMKVFAVIITTLVTTAKYKRELFDRASKGEGRAQKTKGKDHWRPFGGSLQYSTFNSYSFKVTANIPDSKQLIGEEYWQNIILNARGKAQILILFDSQKQKQCKRLSHFTSANQLWSIQALNQQSFFKMGLEYCTHNYNKMKTFESYTYNFNPRDGPKDIKLRYLMKTGVMRRGDIPIGKFTQDQKFETSCASYYLRYNDCLARNMFDRNICRENENSMISCEHKEGLYPNPEDLINRLKLGLDNSKKRREKINAKLEEQFSKISGNSRTQQVVELEPLTVQELAMANEMTEVQGKYQQED